MVAAMERQIEAAAGKRRRYDGPAAGAALATLAVGCVLALTGAPLLLPMVAGLAVVAVAAVVRPPRSEPADPAEAQSQDALRGGVAAILSGIADPVVVLDPQGNVSMFNAKAKAALPQLEVARSLSFAVRSPEVVSAVERVLREGAVAETEFHEKVPVERSFEVRATPVRLDTVPGPSMVSMKP